LEKQVSSKKQTDSFGFQELQFFKNIADTIALPALSFGLKLNLTYFNKEVSEITGLPFNTHISLTDIIHPDDVQQLSVLLNKLLQNPEQFQIQIRIKSDTGTYIPFRFSGSPVVSDSMIIGFYGFLNSEKISILNNRKGEYKTFLQDASDGVFILDHDGKFVEVNNKCVKSLEYSLEELVGMPFHELCIPEDLEKDPLQLNLIQRGKTVIKERRLKIKSGRIVEYELSAKLMSDDRILGMIRDITERKTVEALLKQSDERYSVVIEKTGQVVYDYEISSGKITWWGAVPEITDEE
jgi:PAS domain S-box-containing protein